MATGWPLEARIALLHECWLAAGHEPKIIEADGARADWFGVTTAILDDTTFKCTTHQRLIGQLKKTAVWPKVLPFLTNGDGKCATCGHHDTNHGGYGHNRGTTRCTHTSHTWINGHSTPGVACECQKFVVKPMK